MGRPPTDPTAEWPQVDGETPVISLEKLAIGSLKFGRPLEEARIFGRPDSCRRFGENYLQLVYARAGFQLDFEQDRFVYATFFIGRESNDPRVAAARSGSPRDDGGWSCSPETTQADLVQRFGEPESIDASEPEEVIVNFFTFGLVLEFEFDQGGKLQRWNLFPEEEISP